MTNVKPKLLVVSYGIPRPDKSSGELRFVSILQTLLEFWEVDFCVAESRYEVNWNLQPDMIPYIDYLTSKGIHVLPYQHNAFKNAIAKNKYNGAYFNLYWTAEKLAPLFKKAQPWAYSIVDSVDVHFAREISQANLGEIEMSQALNTKKEELAVYNNADVVIAVSNDDYKLLTEEEKVKNVFVVPNVIPVYQRKPGKREPIVVFIGSYTWPPNIDSVKWFTAEVWPEIFNAEPSARFLIIGSDPTKEVLELDKIDGVEVLGYVPQTKPYLEMAAVSVAPLRYGGGMKGKVNEAMSYGLPVVATTIGAQGFDATNGNEMMIADDASGFARHVIDLLRDDDLQQRVGLAGLELNAAISSPAAVKIKIEALFNHCESHKPISNAYSFFYRARLSFSIWFNNILATLRSFLSKIKHNKKKEPTEIESKQETIIHQDKTEIPKHIELKYPLPGEPKGVLTFPKISASPLVSIIIPVYNQWKFTFACLKSILENSKNIDYEVILADDNSLDETKEAEKFVENINIIRNKTNLGFLHNCNNAAQKARGKYLLFLNNDTLVQPGWLYWFTKTLEEKPDVGLAGAKVIFATGKLQEAGSIVFKDGSAMNYGREDDPGLPQYNYFKDVDYGSGCSICVRKTLWEKTGGFDTRYAPAYYEDTDLAVQIRQLGYRTVYQPKTEIIHFEGASHGTDLTEGVKQNQVKNQKVFYEKWKEEFEKNNFNRDENLFRARERTMHKKMVLIVDQQVPDVSINEDNSPVVKLINLFISEHYVIKFLPDDFSRHENCTTEFEQQGIEFLYGERCRHQWKQWLETNLKNFDIVCFANETIKAKYSDTILSYFPKEKIKLYNQILNNG